MKKETKNHWNPKINEMPDLGHLNDKLLLDILLNIVFGGAGPNDVTARALWINYIRLVDKSVFEYKNARDSLEEYVSTPNKVIYPLFRCISHLENCIDSVKRAVFFARKMRRNKEIPEINKLPLLSDATNKKLRYFRDAIEHLENDVVENNISEDNPTMLLIRNNSITLAGEKLSYHELSEWIHELYNLAKDLKDYRDI